MTLRDIDALIKPHGTPHRPSADTRPPVRYPESR